MDNEITAVVGVPFGVLFWDLPGSGYVWSVAQVPAGLQVVGTDSTGGDPADIEATRRVITFVARRAGTFSIRCQLKRPWETAAADERRLTIRVTDA